jgi:hypothetical protein
MLVVLVLLVLAIGLVQLLSENFHLLVESVYNVLHFIVNSLLGILLVLLLLNFSPYVSPSAKGLDFHTPVVSSFSLGVLDFESLLLDLVFVQK